jgi:serine protease Do
MKYLRMVIFATALASAQTAASKNNPLAAMSSEIRTLTEQASRAVVEIQVTGYGASEDGAVSAGTVSKQQGLGSGVIIDPSGYIVTNAHVVGGAIDVKVWIAASPQNGEEDAPLRRLDAKILGVDRDSDLAVLKVEATGLPILPFAKMESLRQGDLVLAIGNPMGLRNSVSLGVVSATARSLSETSPFGYIQTDASINPGNSGGALVDAEGRLVGINTFILSRSGGNEGLGFAIPGNIVEDVVDQIRKKGHVDRGEIGVIMEDISPALASALALPRSRGVILSDVEPESPAAVAGLQIGDILRSVNGFRVDGVSAFRSYAYSRQQGEKLQIEYQRGTETRSTEVVLRARHAAFDPLAALASPEDHLVPRLGVLGIEIDRETERLIPQLREQSGVIVATRAGEGVGQSIDLQAGDVIHAINGTPVVSLEYLRNRIKDFPAGAAVALQVERDGRMQYVAFEIE